LPRSRVTVRARAFRYAIALAIIAALTALFLPLRGILGFAQLSWLYLCGVVAIAWLVGTGPALIAAAAAFLLGDFFLTAPFGTLHVSNPFDVIQLVVFLLAALLVGGLTGRLQERELEALRNEREATALARLAGQMAEETDADRVVRSAVDSLMRLESVSSITVWLPGNGGALSASGPGARFATPDDFSLADSAFREVKAHGLPSPPPGAAYLGSGWPAGSEEATANGVYVPLLSTAGVEGVVQVLPQWESWDAEDAALVVSVANLLAAFLAARRAVTLRATVEAAEEADAIKSAIVSAVSHEIKTPLAAAMASVTDLVETDVERTPEEVRAQLVSAERALERLEAAIADLLDLSRVQADAWLPQPDVYEVGEIFADVLDSLAELRPRVRFEIAGSPEAYVDFSQLARALKAILENAAEYAPAETAILMGAEQRRDRSALWIEDRGPGVSDADKPFVFDRAYRGEAGSRRVGSTGLGLTIARDLVQANGGTLRVEDAAPRGSRFVVELPSRPPEVEQP